MLPVSASITNTTDSVGQNKRSDTPEPRSSPFQPGRFGRCPQIHTDYYKMQEYGTQTSARAFLRSNCHTTLFFSFSFLHNSHQIPWELYSTHTLEKVTQLLQLILPHAHQWGIKKTKKEYYCDEIYMLCTVTDRPHHGHPLLPGVCLPAWPPRSSGLSSSRPPVQPPRGTV